MKRTAVLLILLGVTVPQPVWGDAPRTISYQGVLRAENWTLVPDGVYEMTFRLYDGPETGTVLWVESDSVNVARGVFNVILGKREILDLPFDRAYWLGVTVEDDSELVPRVELAGVPYAFRTTIADSALAAPAYPDDDWVVAGDNVFHLIGGVGIGTPNPAERLDVAGTVRMTGFKMLPGSASGHVLTSDASGEGRWASPAGDVSAVMVGEGLTGGADSGDVYIGIADGGVTSPKLADSSVTHLKLATGAVDSDRIADGTIEFADIAQNGATYGQVMKWMGDGWVLSEDFGVDGPISGVFGEGGLGGGGSNGTFAIYIADGGVEAKMIAQDAVDSDNIVDAAVMLKDLNRNGALEGQVVRWTNARGGMWDPEFIYADITSIRTSPGSGLTGGLDSGDVYLAIADRGVTTARLADSSVTSVKIKNGSVCAADLADTAVTTVKLGSEAVSEAKLQDEAVSDKKIKKDAVTTDKIRKDAVDTEKILDATLLLSDIAQNGATDGQIIRWSVSKDGWVVDSLEVHGDITAVFTPSGGGLAGGADSGDVHLSIAYGGIVETMLADSLVTSIKIKDGAVSSVDLADTAVTATKLANASVTENKIQDDAVSDKKIKDKAVTKGKIDDNAVSSGEVEDRSLLFDDIHQNGAADGQVMKWYTAGGGWVPSDDLTGGGNGWVDEGTVLRLEDSADSVGVGTSSPSENLDVEGNIHASGKAAFGQGHVYTGANSFVAGSQNTATGSHSSVGGGAYNCARGEYSVIAGGGGKSSADSNAAVGPWAVVGGGQRNAAGEGDVAYATVAGGQGNRAIGNFTSVGGGRDNSAGNNNGPIPQSSGATVAGGEQNEARANGTTVGGGYHNIAGGPGGGVTGEFATVGGGHLNQAISSGATVAGGSENVAGSEYRGGQIQGHPTVGGGFQNQATGTGSTVGGGSRNMARGMGSVVCGGGGVESPADSNAAWGEYCVVGGGARNLVGSAVPAPPEWTRYSAVSGGYGNSATGYGMTVGGGIENLAGPRSLGEHIEFTTVGGGYHNTARCSGATVGGGGNNTAGGPPAGPASEYATVCGGAFNKARGRFSVVCGGGGTAEADSNAAWGAWSVVAGGSGNVAGIASGGAMDESAYATIGGGRSNSARGRHATVPGGAENRAEGDYSFAAGYRAMAMHASAFVWSDSADGSPPFESTAENQFLIRASGGVGIGTNHPQVELDVAGTVQMQGFELPGDTQAGYVLTSDVSGVGMWLPPPAAELDLPYEASASTSGAAFEIDNLGGGAALMGIGHQPTGIGVHGATAGGTGIGVYGEAIGEGIAVYGENHSVQGRAIYGRSPLGLAGYFEGDVEVTGTLTKGGGAFKIDHPLDPENKYLYHSFVESPDMMNVYNGNVVLDGAGEGWVQLPDWFEALNRDFRYQLTCIGGFAPVYVAEEVSGNRFKIAGGEPAMKVSWQVTGVRHDPFAEAHRFPVEQDKPDGERGEYLHPEVQGVARAIGE